jgi:hypothetical protein
MYYGKAMCPYQLFRVQKWDIFLDMGDPCEPEQKIFMGMGNVCESDLNTFFIFYSYVYVLWESHVPIPTYQSSEMGYFLRHAGSMWARARNIFSYGKSLFI